MLPSKGRIRTIEEFATALLPRQAPTPSEAPTKEAVRITDEEEPRPAAQSPKKGGRGLRRQQEVYLDDCGDRRCPW